MKLLTSASLLLVVVSCSVSTHAQEGFPSKDELMGTQLNWDNDLWAPSKIDRWYTNGIRYSWTYRKTPNTVLAREFADASKVVFGPSSAPTLTYTVGQLMYTPRDITVSGPQPNDRPWGGFLYFGLTAHAYEGRTFSAAEVKLGLTGKYAFAEQTQTAIHKIVDSARPAGWDQQLEPRLGAQLTYTRLSRFGNNLLNDRVGFQLGWGGAVGTVRTYANVNATMLIGDLDGNDPPILIGNEGDFISQDFNNRPVFKKPFGYISAGLNAVGYNYFLTGPTPYGASLISPLPGFVTIQVGVSVPLQHWLKGGWPRLVYAVSARSPEFENAGLGQGAGIQRWGTFTANWDFQ